MSGVPWLQSRRAVNERRGAKSPGCEHITDTALHLLGCCSVKPLGFVDLDRGLSAVCANTNTTECAKSVEGYECNREQSRLCDLSDSDYTQPRYDPTDPRFAWEQTFTLLRQKFEWAWEDVPLAERVTLPANGRYPDASFDGFLVRGAAKASCKPIPIQGVSDHFPVVLTVAIE